MPHPKRKRVLGCVIWNASWYTHRYTTITHNQNYHLSLWEQSINSENAFTSKQPHIEYHQTNNAIILYTKNLESLFGGSSRGAQLLVHPWSKTGLLLELGRWSSSTKRAASGGTHVNQISQINPGDQWGDRCRSQITLTSPSMEYNWNFPLVPDTPITFL